MTTRPLKLKAQILCGNAIAFGPGKADLLDAIAAHGSISAAGRAMGMSYRRTWNLVDEMNRCFQGRLVTTEPGGGGGASLTPDGHAVLAAYRALQSLLETTAQDAASLSALQDKLRTVPLPSISS